MGRTWPEKDKKKEFCKEMILYLAELKPENDRLTELIAELKKGRTIWPLRNSAKALAMDTQELRKKFHKFIFDTVRETVENGSSKIFLNYCEKMNIEGVDYQVGDKLKFIRYSQHHGYGDKDIEIIGFDAMSNNKIVVRGSKDWVDSMNSGEFANYFELKK